MSSSTASNDATDRRPSDPGRNATYTILLRDFGATVAVVGRDGRPPVRISLRLTVTHPGPGFPDDIAAVMSYEDIVEDLRRICAEETVPGPEHLAERAADICLSHVQVKVAEVEVELPSPDPAVAGAGATITRVQRNIA